MKVILILLVFVSLLAAQYANNEVLNQNFETWATSTDAANWNEYGYSAGVRDIKQSTVVQNGTYSAGLLSSGSGSVADFYLLQNLTLDSGSVYRYEGWYYYKARDNVGKAVVQLRDATTHNVVNSTVLTNGFVNWDTEITVDQAACNIRLYSLDPNTDTLYYDNVEVRKKIDTLWIDGVNGSDVDDDTVKTLVEAFETRGAHSGGYFITEAGTYNESITIDNSFEYWKASGGAVKVTSVDFNHKALKVDYDIWKHIRSKSNTENVSVVIANDTLKRMRLKKGFKSF